jgi:type IV pilus assembly protein PilE
MKKQDNKGFSLIELLVVIAIVAILAAMGYPSYLTSVRESRRSEAITELLRLQANYETSNAQSNAYPASNMVSGGGPIGNTNNYSYSTTTTANSYTLTATALSTSDQVNDAQNGNSCATLSIDNTGLKTPAACWRH